MARDHEKVNEYLKPTDIIDWDEVVIQEKAKQVTIGCKRRSLKKQGAYFTLCEMRLGTILSYQDPYLSIFVPVIHW